ncbi:MAG: MarR family transcriptional regulator [Verrucomicrobiota bacterium]
MNHKFLNKDSPVFLMDRTAHTARKLIAAICRRQSINLTPEEGSILVNIAELGEQRIGDLAKILIRDATTLSRQVESLEKKALVERVTSLDDRRSVSVKITKTGQSELKKIMPHLDQFRSEVLAGFSDQEVTQLIDFQKRILTNMGVDLD